MATWHGRGATRGLEDAEYTFLMRDKSFRVA